MSFVNGVRADTRRLLTVFQNFLLIFLSWNFIAAIEFSLQVSIKRENNNLTSYSHFSSILGKCTDISKWKHWNSPTNPRIEFRRFR